MALPINQIICGDCAEIMKGFPDNSIDCAVTDPQYGIGFMGKKWDQALPPKEAFQQMFRVLKPGALAFVMSSPRQDVLWRMLAMLEECEFQLKQSFVSWIYKSGFPKAYDISLGIDKKFIRQEFIEEHGRKPTKEEMKKLVKEKRKVIGSRNLHKWDSGKGSFRHHFGDFEGNFNEANQLTEPFTEQAKKWRGWKSITGLKPALECILMVNKPRSERTIVDNVLKHGTGAINMDACRIPFGDLVDKEKSKHNWKPDSSYPIDNTVYEYGSKILNTHQAEKGRFPANLLVSDKALDTGKITKSSGGINEGKLGVRVYGKFKNETIGQGAGGYGDLGDQSRYFDLDAWAEHHGFLDVPKASKRERDMGLEGKVPKVQARAVMMTYANNTSGRVSKGFERFETKPKRNIHPTVKPVKLGAYLVTLGCPPDGVMVDPFCGTGSFLISAHKMGRKWIGIDIEEEYVKIAKYRLSIDRRYKTLDAFSVKPC